MDATVRQALMSIISASWLTFTQRCIQILAFHGLCIAVCPLVLGFYRYLGLG